MKTLSEEIKGYLREHRKTQSDLARAAGVPQSTICALLSGRRRNVTYQTADRLRSVMSGDGEE